MQLSTRAAAAQPPAAQLSRCHGAARWIHTPAETFSGLVARAERSFHAETV